MLRKLITRLFASPVDRQDADDDARSVVEDWADGHDAQYPGHSANIWGPYLTDDGRSYEAGCSRCTAAYTEPIEGARA